MIGERCVRCGAIRTDDVESNICDSCADDLREEETARQEEAQREQAYSPFEGGHYF